MVYHLQLSRRSDESMATKKKKSVKKKSLQPAGMNKSELISALASKDGLPTPLLLPPFKTK
jgi:hypothetical protein